MTISHDSAPREHLAQWQDRLQEAVDQALSPAATLQVHAHLSDCALCAQEHRRLVALDARLRSEFSATTAPAARLDRRKFDQRLFASIAAVEQDQRAQARQREQLEYAQRLARSRTIWRELFRFQLGNVIGGVATIAAVVTAIISTRPSLPAALGNVSLGKDWVPQGWLSALPLSPGALAIVMASITIGAAAFWIAQRLDHSIR